jgi:hypothetical protein
MEALDLVAFAGRVIDPPVVHPRAHALNLPGAGGDDACRDIPVVDQVRITTANGCSARCGADR